MQTQLTDDLAKKLCAAVSVGATLEDAAQGHVSRATVYRWLKTGRDEAQRRAEEEPPDRELDLFVEFAEGVEQARAQAKVEALTIVRQWALGMQVTETRTTRTSKDVLKDGVKITLVTETVTTIEKTETAPQLAAWFLERRYPREFALKNRVELTGEDGAPIRIEERASKLADEVEAYRQGLADAADASAHDDAAGA